MKIGAGMTFLEVALRITVTWYHVFNRQEKD
jgi:hypothetical protein